MEVVTGKLTYERGDRIGIGEGLCSEVYRAREIALDRIVAVKEISKADLSIRGVHDYFREAKLLFGARHNNVAEIYTAVDRDDIVALVMPFYENGSLSKRIQNGAMPLGEALKVMHDVLLGLGVVHMRNLVHFDLKPTNVLFATNGRAMVADFGQSRMLDDRGVAEEPAIYPYAVPPEVERYHSATNAADIWQAGLLLYRVVNGDQFYRNEKARQLAREGGAAACRRSGRIVDVSRFQPHVPQSLRRIVARAMAFNPAERFESAEQLSDALGRLQPALDWRMTVDGDLSEWRTPRQARSELVVQLQHIPQTGRRSVRVFKNGKGGLRACEREQMWRDNLTERQAEEHLRKSVFNPLARK